MSKEIKNFGDQITKESIEMKGMRSRGPYQYPSGPGLNPMAMMGSMPMLSRSGMPMMPGMPMLPGMPGMNPLAQSFGGMPNGPLDRNEFIKEKEQYLTQDVNVVRRMMFPFIRTDAQEIVKDVNQAIMLSNKIISTSDLKTLFTLIENKEELRRKVLQAQSTNPNPLSGPNPLHGNPTLPQI